MDIEISQVEDVTVVTIEGELDGRTAPIAQNQVLPLAEPGCKLLLDLSRVPYMSSAGLRMMLLVYRQVTAQDGRAVLSGLSDDIKDTMEVTGFLNYFETSDTVEEGLQSLAD